ncbi:unnamed protein product [Spodoptera exigua]|nr:unnamed protein product [Spodoptera exigua]
MASQKNSRCILSSIRLIIQTTITVIVVVKITIRMVMVTIRMVMMTITVVEVMVFYVFVMVMLMFLEVVYEPEDELPSFCHQNVEQGSINHFKNDQLRRYYIKEETTQFLRCVHRSPFGRIPITIPKSPYPQKTSNALTPWCFTSGDRVNKSH